MKLKKFLLTSLCSMLFAVNAQASSDITVTLNGSSIDFDVPPQIIDGRTMVPIRAIFERMGAEVTWDDGTKTAVSTKGGNTVKMTLGKKSVSINGSYKEMDTPPVIIDGRILVPARYAAESFGYTVDWQSSTRTVIISGKLDTAGIPPYTFSPYVEINGNVPYFTDSDMTLTVFENYSGLDSLGRCGTAYANICRELMPTEERGQIGMVKPSGWQTVKYDIVDGKYLYNRCHLIGFQLAGENANEKNLITGTRYMNTEGMLPFENMVDDYVEKTNNHVLYRVTPMYTGSNLVADGVLMEAKSVEDNGGLQFNVYCYNVQPGITINYTDGSSSLSGTPVTLTVDDSKSSEYIGNKNTKKFHYSSCKSVSAMNESNKVYLDKSRDEIIDMGYTPCGNCKP